MVGIFYLNKSYKNNWENKTIQKQKSERLKIFGNKTVDFFEKFDCNDLQKTDKETKIIKFITVDYNCNPDLNLNVYDDLHQYFTKNIDSANVIIKIFSVPGKKETENYQRLKNRIIFIDKKSKKIFKVIYVDFEDEIPKSKQNGISYFGQEPSKENKIAILNYIKTQ